MFKYELFLSVLQIFFFFAHGLIEYESFLNRSIRPIDGTLTGTNILGQSGPRSNGNEGVLNTPQISTRASQLDAYTGHHFLGEVSNPSSAPTPTR